MKRSLGRQVLSAAAVTLAVLPMSAAAVAQAAHGSAHALKKYAGSTVVMRWGAVKVTIEVRGKRIVNVFAVAPLDRPRSAFINNQALPLLKQEVLQAQSAKLNLVSGATMTSKASITSLQSTLRRAHL